MYTLILLLTVSDFKQSPTISSVPGFDKWELCREAAREAVSMDREHVIARCVRVRSK